jgi:hypothetical protein
VLLHGADVIMWACDLQVEGVKQTTKTKNKRAASAVRGASDFVIGRDTPHRVARGWKTPGKDLGLMHLALENVFNTSVCLMLTQLTDDILPRHTKKHASRF